MRLIDAPLSRRHARQRSRRGGSARPGRRGGLGAVAGPQSHTPAASLERERAAASSAPTPAPRPPAKARSATPISRPRRSTRSSARPTTRSRSTARRSPMTRPPARSPLRDDEGKPIASMFYVAYVADHGKGASRRPVTFFYNGGPGSSSAVAAHGLARAECASTPIRPQSTHATRPSTLEPNEVFADRQERPRLPGRDRHRLLAPARRHQAGRRSGASIRTSTPSPAAFVRYLTIRPTAGTHPSSCSARATAPPAQPASAMRCRSTASS